LANVCIQRTTAVHLSVSADDRLFVCRCRCAINRRLRQRAAADPLMARHEYCSVRLCNNVLPIFATLKRHLSQLYRSTQSIFVGSCYCEQGHTESSDSAASRQTTYEFSLVFYANYVTILYRSRDISTVLFLPYMYLTTRLWRYC